MAEGKKSFVLYVDSKETWDELTDEQAGKLIKHVYKYVNDESPEMNDPLLRIAFLPIKQQLKRDLKRWESKQKQRSEAGKRSAEVRSTKSTTVKSRSTKSTVSVNDSVNVNDILKEKDVFNFKTSLLELGIEQQIVSDWLKVRTKKKAVNSETAFKSIKTQIEKSGLTANDCIRTAVEKSWAGFDSSWITDKSHNLSGNNTVNSPIVKITKPKPVPKGLYDN